jgi:hypothetical protein
LADTLWLTDYVLKTGSPKELIASGAINQAFDTQSVQFSGKYGRFELIDKNQA